MRPTPPSTLNTDRYLQPDNEKNSQSPTEMLQQQDVKTSPLEMLTQACDNIGLRDFPFIRDPERRSSPAENNHFARQGSTPPQGKETINKEQETPETVTLGVTLMEGLSSKILTNDSAPPSLTTKHHGGVTSQGVTSQGVTSQGVPFKKTSTYRRRPSTSGSNQISVPSGTWYPPLENLMSRFEPTDRSSIHLLPQYSRPRLPSSTFKAMLSHGCETPSHRDNSQDWTGYHNSVSATSPLRGVKPLRCSLVGWSLPGVFPLGGCLASTKADNLNNNNLLTAAYSKNISPRSGFGEFLPVSNASSSSSSEAAAGTDARASPLSCLNRYCPVDDNKGKQRSLTSCNCIFCLLAQHPHLQSQTTDPAVACDQCQLIDKTLGGASSSSGILPGRSELIVHPRPIHATPQFRHYWRSLDRKANPFSLSVEPSTLRRFSCNWIQTDATICGKLFRTKEELLDHLRSHSLFSIDNKAFSPAGLHSTGSLPKVEFSFPDLFWWNHLQKLSLAAASPDDPLPPVRCFETSAKTPASRYHPYKAALSSMICHGSERAPLHSLCPGCLPNDYLQLQSLLYSPGRRRLETSITGS